MPSSSAGSSRGGHPETGCWPSPCRSEASSITWVTVLRSEILTREPLSVPARSTPLVTNRLEVVRDRVVGHVPTEGLPCDISAAVVQAGPDACFDELGHGLRERVETPHLEFASYKEPGLAGDLE